jgi:DNA-binding IclR family transcriptional regulator
MWTRWSYAAAVEATAGAQVVGRVGAVLRAVAAAPDTGATTTEVAGATGLTRPTAHRLLSSLLAEGLLDRDQASGRWHLGPEMYLMGAVAAHRYDVTPAAREVVAALAEATGESAFFSARRGPETVCLLRVDGSFPIRSFVLSEGVRFPLGVASAGLVVLAHLPDREVTEFLDGHDLTERFGPEHAREPVLRRIRQTRQRGYAVNPGLLVEGSYGMGAAVFTPDGRPEWALSLTGVDSRFRPARQPELGRLLLDAAHRLGQAVARTRPPAAAGGS